MKRFLAFFLLIVICSVAADADAERTGTRYNGRYWNSLTEEMKIGYASGFGDGFRAIGYYLEIANLGEPTTVTGVTDQKNDVILDKVYPVSSTYAEIVSMLNRFYSDGANARIPIVAAIHIVKLEASGATVKELAEVIASYRRISQFFSDVAKSKIE
jgi:hypothetical protein